MLKRSEDIKVANVGELLLAFLNKSPLKCSLSRVNPKLNPARLEFKWASHWCSLYVRNHSWRVASQLVRTLEKQRVYLGKGTSIPPCRGVSIELILRVGCGFIVWVIYDPCSMSNKEIGKLRTYINTFMRAWRNLRSVLMQFRSNLFQSSLSWRKDVV